ncbi:MAG TPA: His/Gly/Thr/Pro-type tRNA ligase C-terminal domain-containing protein, partial [Patescibacteria group bacterium]
NMGIQTEVYTEQAKFKKKLEYANRIGVPYVAIIGEDEVQQRKISLKAMKTGEQVTVPVEEAVSLIRRQIS